MKRRVLVTTVINTQTGVQSEIYGRYDAVALASKNLHIVRSFFRQYEMSDAEFAKYGHFVKEITEE